MKVELSEEELERRLPGLINLIADIKNNIPTVLVVPYGMELAARQYTGGLGNKHEVTTTCGVCGARGKAGVKSMRLREANRVCLVCLKLITDHADLPLKVIKSDDVHEATAGTSTSSLNLTQVEIQRRRAGLTKIFSAERPVGAAVVMVHRVVDREMLKQQGWSPSIEHTLTTCDVCDDQCWIGPRQAKLLPAADKVCSVCICLASVLSGGELPTVEALNPNESEIPRRN